MRIVSQNGTVDLPYESVVVGISNFDNNVIIAYPINTFSTDDYWTMARYSTEQKAKKALDLLHDAYVCNKIFKSMSEQQRALIAMGSSEDEKLKLGGVFHFYSDNEMEN